MASPPDLAGIEARLRRACRADETAVVDALAAECAGLPPVYPAARQRALAMIERARGQHSFIGDLNDLLHEFPLSSEEGQALMALAEALLRIPDAATIERLIAEKLQRGSWSERAGDADSLLGRIAAQALAAASRIASPPGQPGGFSAPPPRGCRPRSVSACPPATSSPRQEGKPR